MLDDYGKHFADGVVSILGEADGAIVGLIVLLPKTDHMLLDNIALTQALAQKENHFRSLVQGSSDVIMIAAPNGVLQYQVVHSLSVGRRYPLALRADTGVDAQPSAPSTS